MLVHRLWPLRCREREARQGDYFGRRKRRVSCELMPIDFASSDAVVSGLVFAAGREFQVGLIVRDGLQLRLPLHFLKDSILGQWRVRGEGEGGAASV